MKQFQSLCIVLNLVLCGVAISYSVWLGLSLLFTVLVAIAPPRNPAGAVTQ